jgi:hypothetical protein
LSYDDNKYCEVLVAGIKKEIKSGYLYSKFGRYREVPVINTNLIKKL